MANIGRFVLLAVALAQAAAPTTAIFVDRTGSLTAEYKAGHMQKVVNCVTGVCGSAELYAFGNAEPYGPCRFSDIEGMGYYPYTRIDLAANAAVRRGYDMAWIITDNEQHLGAGVQPGVGIRMFYRYVADDFGSAVLIPVRAPSQGLTGLAVYAFARSGQDSLILDMLAKRVDDFVQRARGAGLSTDAFWLKPFDEGAVEIKREADRPALRDFEEGTTVADSETVAFHSTRAHIDIRNATIVVDSMRVELPPEFSRRQYSIDPVSIRQLPANSTATGFVITYDFGRYTRQGGLAGFLKAMFSGGDESYGIKLYFHIEVDKANVNLSQKFLGDWNAASSADAVQRGTVVGLDSLTSYIADETLRVPCFFETRFKISVGIGYVIALGLFILLLLGLGYLVYRLLSGGFRPTRRWQVSVVTEGGEEECQVSTKGPVATVFRGSETYGQIQSGRQFIAGEGWELVQAASSFMVELKEGAAAKLRRRDGTAVELRFRTPGGKAKPRIPFVGRKPAVPPAPKKFLPPKA